MGLKPAALYHLAPTCLNVFERCMCSEVKKNLEVRKLFSDFWSLLEKRGNKGESTEAQINLGSIVQ